MSRRKRADKPLSQLPVPEFLRAKARAPLAILLGSPAEVVNLVSGLPGLEPVCFQFDLYQAARLREMLAEAGLAATVVTHPDVWDMAADFASAIFLPARGGERELKIDVLEQAYHVLRDKGVFLVWSPYEADSFFSAQMKKIFGRVHNPPHDSGETSSLLWAARDGDKPRRRHEITFQVKIGEGPSCRFVSRPGTFSYGKFDNGARAMCEVMEIEVGDRVLDLGCGVGTNGVFAAQKAGPHGHIAFVDSNVRAIALTELNAKANGVENFTTFATESVEGPEEDSFDVVIANPPYFANSSVAHLFITKAKRLLTPQGKLFLVTRQAEALSEVLLETFEEAEGVMHRGYTILCA